MAVTFGGISQAKAGLIGDTVTVDFTFSADPSFNDTMNVVVVDNAALPEIGHPSEVVVDPDPFGDLRTGEFIDITANSFVGHFNTGYLDTAMFIFSDLDWVGTPGTIIGVDVVSTWAGFDASDVSFTDDSVTLDVGLTFDAGDFTVTLATSHDPVVPEPSTLVLWSLGTVALVGFGYRRRKRAA